MFLATQLHLPPEHKHILSLDPNETQTDPTEAGKTSNTSPPSGFLPWLLSLTGHARVVDMEGSGSPKYFSVAVLYC